MGLLRRHRDGVVLGLLLAVASVTYFTLENDDGHVGGVAELDGFYYYVYLRSVQMDGDIQFADDYDEWGDPFELGTTPTGRGRNIFGPGPALLWSPFFVVTHLVVLAGIKLGYPLSPDGLSRFHQVGTFYGTLLLGWLAVVLCYRIARQVHGKAGALWAALGAALAGPLPYYCLSAASYSHAQAAAATSLLVLLWLRWRQRWTLRRWLVFGGVSGLVVLIRPASLPFMLLPVIEGVGEILPGLRARSLRRAGRALLGPLAGGGAALLAFSPQLITWYILFGRVALVPQGRGFMWWSDPAWAATLFSPRNGLFPSAPLLAVAVVGLVLGLRRRASVAGPLLAVLALMVVETGAVSDWWGWGFSARRFTACLPIFTVGLAAALAAAREHLSRRPERTAAAVGAVVVVAAVVFNLQWMVTHSTRRLAWSGVHSTQAQYMTVTHSLVDNVYDAVGNPLSLPGSLAFAARQGGSPRIYDQIHGSYLLGESHPEANPAADLHRHATMDLGDSRYRPYLSTAFGNPKREGQVGYVPLRAPRGHVFLPINRPGPVRIMLGARATRPGARVSARFNGTPLSTHELPERWTRIVLQVPARHVRRGINRLDLVHQLPPPPADPVSRCLPGGDRCAPVSLAAVSGGRRWGEFAELWVGGRRLQTNVRGVNAAVVDPDRGTLLGQRGFDTAIYPAGFGELERYLEQFPRGSFVLLATRGAAGKHFGPAGRRALARIGATTDLYQHPGAGFAALGALGAPAGAALEAITDRGHARVRLGPPPPPWRELAHYRVIVLR